jgi:hypothetical protein
MAVSEVDWGATWDAYGIYAIIGAALLLLVVVLRVRSARRRRKLLESRHTQFAMAAIDPAVAEHNRAAFERVAGARPVVVDVRPGFAPPPALPPQRAARGSNVAMPMLAPVQARPAAHVVYVPARSPAPAPPPSPATAPTVITNTPSYPLTFPAATLATQRRTMRGHAVEPAVAQWDTARDGGVSRDDDDDDDGADFTIQFARS